jgi:hypothetical protein
LQTKLQVNPNDDLARKLIEMYIINAEYKEKLEKSEAWMKNNLEYDLRNSDYIVEKCKIDSYAQNLYAALCNNDFMRNEMWPILKEETWGCSWRYAGGIIADILQRGDYLDWYCSGIMQEGQYVSGYVAESVVTDEIRTDLLTLGWIVLDSDNSE